MAAATVPDVDIQQLLRQGKAWYQTLRQTKTWRTQDGQVLEVEQMTDSHRRNLMRWLDRRAKRIAHLSTFGSALCMGQALEHAGDMSSLAIERDMEREWDAMDSDPLTWLRGTPLYRRLRELSPEAVI